MAKTATEVIRFAGDVSIDHIEIVSVNGSYQTITNQVAAIEIYEDIFSPFISGVLGIRESFDLVNLFPLIGEEILNIKIRTPSFTKKGNIIDDEFVIYKIANRTMVNDRNIGYELHFISREAIVDINKKISKSYQGKVSDIAKEILKDKQFGLESIKPLNIEETRNATKYISNYWSPVKNLNYIAETAKNTDNVPNYLFFENKDGFQFRSLDSLYNQEAIQEFRYDGYSRDFKPNNSSYRNIEENYKRIQEIDIPLVYDYIERASLGMYASKRITHDLVTKKYKVYNYIASDDFNNSIHLNKFPNTTSKGIYNPNMLVVNSGGYYANFNGYIDTTNNSSMQRRIALMNAAETSKIKIRVAGRTDYTAGDKVYVSLPKISSIHGDESINDVTDQMFSGFYIISSINHSIDRERHECYIELIKDSFISDLEGK